MKRSRIFLALAIALTGSAARGQVDINICGQCIGMECATASVARVCWNDPNDFKCHSKTVPACVKPRGSSSWLSDDPWDNWDRALQEWRTNPLDFTIVTGKAAAEQGALRGNTGLVRSVLAGARPLARDEYRLWRDRTWANRLIIPVLDYPTGFGFNTYAEMRGITARSIGDITASHPSQVLYQKGFEQEPVEGPDPVLLYMPAWRIDEILLDSLDHRDRRLARAVAQFAADTTEHDQGSTYSFCVDEEQAAKLSPLAVYQKNIDSKAIGRQQLKLTGKWGYSPAEAKRIRATMPERKFDFINFEVEWDLVPGEDLPRGVTISYLKPELSVSGARAVKLKLAYAAGSDGEPFAWVQGIEFLVP